jgi:hypothetical protein
VALASMVWTGIRIRAALRLRDDPPAVDLIGAHLASLGVARANG